jgi:small-conductance mechanosensitive channel
MQTILRTWDNRRLIVPNSTLFSEVVTNYSKKDPTMLAPLFITITYEPNLDKAISQAQKRELKLDKLACKRASTAAILI